MAPRTSTLPPAATQSAKQARSAFFCALCQKGYARMNEFEAHESSYDHQHKKRLKEMKEMQRQVQQPKKEEKGGGMLMQIKIGAGAGAGTKEGVGNAGSAGGAGGGGFKKGRFKNAFAPVEGSVKRENASVADEKLPAATAVAADVDVDMDSDVTDVEDSYDPRKPTGCLPGCPGRAGESGYS